MKNFLMRGVLLVTLLSFLVLPASAAFSNTDSQNIANIKSYTYDIKTAVTSGTLFSNVSSIATSVKNISSTVSSIYTQIQATNNHLSTGNSNTSAISSNTASINSRIGSLNNTGYRSIAEAMFTLGGKVDTSNTKITSFDSNVSSKLGSIITNTGLISASNAYLSDITSNSGSTNSKVSTISSDVKTISNKINFDGLATEVKQDSIVSQFVDANGLLSDIDYKNLQIRDNIAELYANSDYKFFDGYEYSYLTESGALATLASSFIFDKFESWRLDSQGNLITIQDKTIFGHLKNLSDTLASDEDKAIRDSQNENVDAIKGQFVTGSSGGTSLGKDDFGGLSTAGSAAKDLTSLNGQASIGKFTDGLSEANTSGMGWFSADTKNALDTVPPLSGKRAPARDSDPYNMAGFADNYNWLFGGD